MLTFLELRDPLHEGVESGFGALAVGRGFIVELALLLLQLSYLTEELGLQCPQTLAQQLAELWWQGSQGRGFSGWWVCAGEAQALLLGGTPQTEIRDRQTLNPASRQCSRLLIRQLCYLFGSIVFDASISKWRQRVPMACMGDLPNTSGCVQGIKGRRHPKLTLRWQMVCFFFFFFFWNMGNIMCTRK